MTKFQLALYTWVALQCHFLMGWGLFMRKLSLHIHLKGPRNCLQWLFHASPTGKGTLLGWGWQGAGVGQRLRGMPPHSPSGTLHSPECPFQKHKQSWDWSAKKKLCTFWYCRGKRREWQREECAHLSVGQQERMGGGFHAGNIEEHWRNIN